MLDIYVKKCFQIMISSYSDPDPGLFINSLIRYTLKYFVILIFIRIKDNL